MNIGGFSVGFWCGEGEEIVEVEEKTTKKKKSMGRGKIEIKKIENFNGRQMG